MAKVSDEVLVKAKEYLKNASAGWTTGVCQGVTWTLSGDMLERGHTACHSWVTTAYGRACFEGAGWGFKWDRPYTKGSKNFLTLSCYSSQRTRYACSKESSDFLVLWMAKHSPFAQFILNADDADSLTQSGVVLLCGPDGLSVTQAMWLLKVLRFTTEGGKAAETFMTLVKGGVDGMLAILIASHVRTIKGATFGYTGLEGHSSVFGYNNDNKVDVKALLTREMNPLATSTQDLFLPNGGKTGKVVKGKIQGFCKGVEKSDGWGGTVKGIGAEKEDLVRHALAWQAEFGDYLQPDSTFPQASDLVAKEIELPMPTSNTVFLELDL